MKSRLFLCIGITLFALFSLTTGCTYDQYLPEEEPVIVDMVTFSGDILPIFNEACNSAGCHNSGGFAPDLSPGIAYDALITGGYIDIAVPDNSELLEWMRGNRRIDMPIEGPNNDYNAAVLAWIKQGALNN